MIYAFSCCVRHFATRSPLQIPHVVIPQECVLEAASVLRIEINHVFAILREIGTGRDIKKFLTVSWSVLHPYVKLCFKLESYPFISNSILFCFIFHLSGYCWIVVYLNYWELLQFLDIVLYMYVFMLQVPLFFSMLPVFCFMLKIPFFFMVFS